MSSKINDSTPGASGVVPQPITTRAPSSPPTQGRDSHQRDDQAGTKSQQQIGPSSFSLALSDALDGNADDVTALAGIGRRTRGPEEEDDSQRDGVEKNNKAKKARAKPQQSQASDINTTQAQSAKKAAPRKAPLSHTEQHDVLQLAVGAKLNRGEAASLVTSKTFPILENALSNPLFKSAPHQSKAVNDMQSRQ